MQTRSQTKALQEYTVNIDFDEASLYWNANKKKFDNCCYKYVCGKQLNNGQFCKKSIYKNTNKCFIHKNTN